MLRLLTTNSRPVDLRTNPQLVDFRAALPNRLCRHYLPAMTAQTVIAEIEAMPASERAKVFAFVGEAIETDDSWIPESFKQAMADAESGRLVDIETVLSGTEPPART